MKILFTYGKDGREGYEKMDPSLVFSLPEGEAELIEGEAVLERVDNLVLFIERCFKALKPGGKCVFLSPYYASIGAWRSPHTKRGISEHSLSFANKAFREEQKMADTVNCDFEVAVQCQVEEAISQRADQTQAQWMKMYNNVAQNVIFTLSKKSE